MSNFKCQINIDKRFQSIGYWILVVLVALVVFPRHAFAESISLGIYPPIIQIDATAPTYIQSPMTITNQSDIPLDIQVVVRPFTAANTDDGDLAYFGKGAKISPDPDIFQKMALFDGTKNTDELTLAPKQQKNVELRITLPNGEPPGDYYFSITYLSKPIATDHDTGSQVSGGISTNVLLSIGPKDTTTGFIKEFAVPLFVESGPVPLTLHVTNTSKHFIEPQGGIVIKNMFGQIIGNIGLEQDNILASSSRYLKDASNLQFPISNFQHPVVGWNEKFLLGPYSATLTLALSGEGPVYRRTIYFFALPIQVLIGIILGIILVTIIVIRVKKRLK